MEVLNVGIDELKKHPRNYQSHPDAQLRHIERSLKTHGFYRAVVVANDNTILAGHGLVEAAKRLGFDSVPVVRVDVDKDSPRALKLLTGDNEISNLAVVDDRGLTDLLKEISDIDGLEGTGFNEEQLASLLFITRPSSEIADKDEAAEWIGMPDFDTGPKTLSLIVHFETDQDRQDFAELLGYSITDRTKFVWFPDKPNDDVRSVEVRG